MLLALYVDLNAVETKEGGKPVLSGYVLEIVATLRNPLSDEDKLRFDVEFDRLIEKNMNARHNQ